MFARAVEAGTGVDGVKWVCGGRAWCVAIATGRIRVVDGNQAAVLKQQRCACSFCAPMDW